MFRPDLWSPVGRKSQGWTTGDLGPKDFWAFWSIRIEGAPRSVCWFMYVYVQKFSHRNICSAINPTLDLLRIQLSDSKLGHHRDRVQILGFPETRRRTDDFPGHVLRPEKWMLHLWTMKKSSNMKQIWRSPCNLDIAFGIPWLPS